MMSDQQLGQIRARHRDGLDPTSAAHDLAALLEEVHALRDRLSLNATEDDYDPRTPTPRRLAGDPPPPGFRAPQLVYVLQATAVARQLGAVRTHEEALAARRHAQRVATGVSWAVNLIPLHERVQDHLWNQ